MGKITWLEKRLIILSVFLLTTAGFAQSQAIFPSNGTFVVPAGVTTVQVEAWGGGGKGGSRTNNGGGGGGGGGGYSRSIISVTPGASYTVNVGTGSNTLANGGDSWFINATTIVARGGETVPNNTTAPGSGGVAGIGDITFVGGDGDNGVSNRGGGGGSSAGNASNGNDGTNNIGGSAPTGGGTGGNGRSGSQGNGSAGTTPGGGGGGAYRSSNSTRNGGNGANGRVVVTWGPEIGVSGNSVAIADGDLFPTAGDWTDFGTTTVSAGTITRTFTINNTGIDVLNISGVTITGTNAADFTITVAPGTTVAAGSSTSFVVSFNPSLGGLRNATIEISSDDASEALYNYAIRGTGGDCEINLEGNSNTIADNDLTPSTTDGTDFGAVNIIGATTIVRTFTVQNLGTDTLIISTPVISGSGDFSVSGLTSTSIAPGGTATFQVTFNPSIIGVKSAVITIANNDADETSYNFNITGLGTDPEINVRGNSTDIASGDNTPSLADFTDFNATNITSGTITRTFTIQNVAGATATLTVSPITISGTNASDFTVTTTPGATVASGSSTTFVITFNPSAVGVRNAVISIPNNDSNESPYTFAVTGTGTDCEIDVQGNGVSIVNNDGIPSLADHTNFGSTDLLSGTLSSTFTILNDSGATMNLNIGTITFFGAAAAEFSVTSLPTASILPGESTTFTVTFNPNVAGVRNANISIPNNDGNESSYVFTLSGVGLDPEIDVQGNAISIPNNDVTPIASDGTEFGFTDVTNGTITRTFTILNMGTATMPLSIGAISISGTNAGDFSFTAPLASSLAVGETTTFTVTFNPGATGTRTATVNIASDDSNESAYAFAIRGTGTDPEINVVGNLVTIADGDTTPSLSDVTDFGTVSIEAGSTLVTYTIQNSGVGNLSIGAVTISGVDAANYTLTIPPAAAIASGGSTTFQISFNPTTPGAKNAVISIVNDDSNENPYNFNITGLGVRTYPDSDGDGVSDNVDIDDDNDGIIDTLEQANCVGYPLATSSEYVFLNETFGAGTTKGLININVPGATCGYCYEDGIVGPNVAPCNSQSSPVLDDGEYVVVHKIAGASASDPENIHFDGAWNGPEDHTVGDTFGRMAVFNASFAPGIFYETEISGIIPNVPITYGFWAMNILSKGVSGIRPNITVQFLSMSDVVLSTFNTGDIGRCLASVTSDACLLSEWHQFTTSVNLGNNSAFKIRFINNAPGGGGNDLAIDDITIKQQYCDRDGDGVANIFDLDSDNDGIPDVEEAGFKTLTAGRGIMNLSTSVWLDANLNGLHDNIDALIAGGTYMLPDSDGDTLCDFVDLDSDNDSLFDVDESGLLNGDGDIDGDGLGDGADTDLDGFLDIFDTFVGHGTAVRPFAANSDAAPNSDYMTIDSNNDGTFDIFPTLYSSLDANGDGVIDGAADVDKDGIRDGFDTTTAFLGSPRDLDRKLFVDLDGRNDYALGTQMLSDLPQATLMGWIKMTSPYSATGFVMGQDNFNIKVTAGTGIKLSTTAKGVTITHATNLVVNRWYHVAAVYDGSHATEKLRLYLNGNQVVTSNSGTLAGALPTSTANFTMGKNATASNQYFKGSIEEVRVFNTALSIDQLQKMVYQEIQQNGTAIRGAVIPKDVETSSWSSLLAYYRMDAFKDDVIDDYTIAGIDNGTSTSFARIYNVKNIRYQLAPMPFVTTQSASITAAVSQANFVNGQDVLDNAWSIVRIKHNINLNFNMTNLGCFIDPAVNLVLNNDNQLRNTWYLKLDGKIDLMAKAQLVQTINSDLDPTSSGFIERDQQGTVNRFNYNYWSSPVGGINSTTNNNTFTVAGVMKDGTNAATPQNILWTSGLNSSSTSPITLSSYWIFKFQNVGESYANWSTVGPNGTLVPGQGYTLKGSNAATATQNYVFVGKPNNGTITSPIAANNLNLSGNPYASAIDANQFITDNMTSLNGTILFWEHFPTNNTHNLADYQGGYATRTLVGGTPPVSPSEVSGLGSSSRVPGRFIPVGQGFFVTGSNTGGTITFNNGQRAFIRETDASSNMMFKQANPVANNPNNQNGNNNNQDTFEEDTHAKIRLGFNSANNYHRQVLLGFMDDLATPGMDVGYDARHVDTQPNDMYFMLGTEKLNILGDDHYNSSDIFPIGVKTAQAGNVSFIIDELENFEEGELIFIHDAQTGIDHKLTSGNPFVINLPAGTVDDRFSLRFKSKPGHNMPTFASMAVSYHNPNNVLKVSNTSDFGPAETVTLFNMLGQQIATWTDFDNSHENVEIPVKNISTGTYIVKIQTAKGDVSKKIIVK